MNCPTGSTPTRRNLSIVIVAKQAASLIRCTNSIRRSLPDLDPSKIICVDAGAQHSAAGETRGVSWIADESAGEDPRPAAVYARRLNYGAKAAISDDLFFVDADAQPTQLGAIHEAAKANDFAVVLDRGVLFVTRDAFERLFGFSETEAEPFAELATRADLARLSTAHVWENKLYRNSLRVVFP